MPRLSKEDRERGFCMLQVGQPKRQVAQHFGCTVRTIHRLWHRFNQTGSTSDRPRSGRPRGNLQKLAQALIQEWGNIPANVIRRHTDRRNYKCTRILITSIGYQEMKTKPFQMSAWWLRGISIFFTCVIVYNQIPSGLNCLIMPPCAVTFRGGRHCVPHWSG